MPAETILLPVKPAAKLLAVLSAVLFWCVPYSPWLSIAAIKATADTPGWPRHVARTAAFLTIAWVTLLTAGVAWMFYVIIWAPRLA